MSQVLGKPQPQDEDDAEEEEEEDELVGLADYGDGPDSSDADPDSGTEEGGERPAPASSARAPFLLLASSRPQTGSALVTDLEGVQGSGVEGLGWGGTPEA